MCTLGGLASPDDQPPLQRRVSLPVRAREGLPSPRGGPLDLPVIEFHGGVNGQPVSRALGLYGLRNLFIKAMANV